MYNVIIIDDDIQIAKTVSKMINYQELGFNVVATFSNGFDALDFLNKNEDITLVISDIEMPYIDGFSLCKEIKRDYPLIKVILMMGYGAFEYAKKSLDMGVSGLIKKPVVNEELFKILNKIKTQFDDEKNISTSLEILRTYQKESLPIVKDAVLYSLVRNSITPPFVEKKLKFLNIDLDYRQFVLACLEFDDLGTRDSLDEVELMLMKIKTICNEYLKQVSKYELFTVDEKILFIFKFDNFSSTSLTKIDTAFTDILIKTKKVLNVSCSIGVSLLCEDLKSLKLAYIQAKHALEYRSFMGSNKIYYYGNYTNKVNLVTSLDLQQISYAINYSDEETIRQILSGVKDKIKQLGNINDYYLTMTRILNEILLTSENVYNVYQKFGVEGDFYGTVITNKDIDITFEMLINICLYIKDDNKKVLLNNIQYNAKQALEYIDNHFDELDMSLESVAEHINLSVSYICYLFKKEKNTTFVKYLTDLRINKAKQLLENTNLKISEIAEKVGYGDSYYFSHIFKKNTGYSPKDYRNRI